MTAPESACGAFGQPVPVDPPPAALDVREVAAHIHQRRPIVPPWLRDRAEFRALVVWLGRYGLHASGFHLARLPLYLARLVARSPRGGWLAVRAWWCWV